ncbi:YwqJ-related putative deaminase [Nocardia takedensis]
MSSNEPSVAASLLIGGTVVSHTDLVGDGVPDLHPVVTRFVETLPADVRAGFSGRCAESALISDQLWRLDAERGDGRTTTLEEAAPHFAGAVLTARRIGAVSGPAAPCDACAALLRALGVTVVR